MEEGLNKHILVLPEIVYFVFWRFGLQKLFYYALISEYVVRDGSGEHRVLNYKQAVRALGLREWSVLSYSILILSNG